MSDLTLGVDVSDVIARLAIVKGSEVIANGIVASNSVPAIKDAPTKLMSSAAHKQLWASPRVSPGIGDLGNR